MYSMGLESAGRLGWVRELLNPQVNCMVGPVDRMSLHGLGERWNLSNSSSVAMQSDGHSHTKMKDVA